MLYIMGAFLLLVALLIFKNSGSFFKALFSSIAGGVGALCAVCAASYFVPLTIGLNWYSLAFSAFFSVPGVIFLLISDVILF